MDPRRLADIRAGTEAQVSSSGTGYLIGERLVLTARHVVFGGQFRYPRIQVLVGHPSSGPQLRDVAEVVWEGPLDVVLLRLAGIGVANLPPVRWGRFATSDPADYSGLSYPRFVDYESGRGVEQLRGTLAPLGIGADGNYVLDQDAAPDRSGKREWAGASGSAVFCAGLLVAVVAKDDDAFGNRRLHAVPAVRMVDDPPFCELVAADSGCMPIIEGVEFVSHLAPSTLHSAVRTPGSLLAEPRQLVKFIGRDDDLAALTEWRDGAQEFAMMLVVADGGHGKSRLAREFLQRSSRNGWITGRLPAEVLIGGGHHLHEPMVARLSSATSPVLIAVDYAETSAMSVNEIVTRLTQTVLPQPVRLLLLARRAGAWWDGLRELLPPGATRRLSLSPLLTDVAQRRIAYESAVNSFCHALAALPEAYTEEVAEAGWQGIAALVTRAVDDFSDDRLANILTLHTQALVDVLSAASGAPIGSVSSAPEVHLVAHERRYLHRLAAKRGLLKPGVMSRRSDSDERTAEVMSLLERALVATILLKPGQPKSLRAITTRMAPDGPEEVAGWLTALYPASEGDEPMGAVQPDRLAEHLTGAVLLVQPDLLSTIRQLDLEIGEQGTKWGTIAVLLRVVEHEQFQAVHRQISDLIASEPQHYLAPVVLLAPTFGQEDIAVAGLVDWASREPEAFSRLTIQLALSAGRWSPTLYAAVRVAKLYLNVIRQLADDIRKAQYRYYGTGLLAYMEFMTEIKRPHEVLAVVGEATAVWTRWAAEPDGSTQRSLAAILTYQACALESLGRLPEALAVSEKAVSFDREAADDPDIGPRLLAMSLDNYANLLAEAGRLAEAVVAGDEAYEIWQELSAQNKSEFREQISISLNNQATLLTLQGRTEEAAERARMALNLAQEMAEEDPLRHFPALRDATMNYGSRLHQLGRSEDALEATTEALRLARMLSRVDEGLHCPALAMVLLNGSSQLLDLDRVEEAVAYADESMSIYADLAETNVGGYAWHYAIAASQLGYALAAGKRPGAAVAPSFIALSLIEHLMEHHDAESVLSRAVTALRKAYSAARAEVTTAYRQIFDGNVPDWISASDDHPAESGS